MTSRATEERIRRAFAAAEDRLEDGPVMLELASGELVEVAHTPDPRFFITCRRAKFLRQLAEADA